jgi:hypothetical protein
MPLAICVFFMFCVNREPVPVWIRWVAIFTAAFYWLRRRSMLRSLPYITAYYMKDLLRKDPACWEAAAPFVDEQ